MTITRTAKHLGFLFLFALSTHLCASRIARDIETPNTGEQGMIACLRNVINQTPELNTPHCKTIIIGAGTHGAEAFKSPAQPGKLHVLLTWQWLKSFNDLAPGTIIVTPQHSVDERFQDLTKKGIELICISGVLHTKTKDKIQTEPTDRIPSSTHFVSMLAGDTQNEDDVWEKYTTSMLDAFLAHLPKDQPILILNGPRTGKHLEESDTLTLHDAAHRTETDYITQAVQDKNVATWHVVDFKYGGKSLWDGALHFCIKHPNVGLVLPGESTSMISEALSLGIRPIVYTHTIMTPSSHRYIQQLQAEDKILTYPEGLSAEDYAQEPVEDQIPKIIRRLIDFV